MSRRRILAAVNFTAVFGADPLLDDLACRSASWSGRLLLVGGAPRDLMLGRPPRDLDFIVAAESPVAERFVNEFAARHRGKLLIFDRKGLRERRVVIGGRDLDFALVTPQGLNAELSRRDFTVNAMAVELPAGELLDPCAGQADLESGTLRQTGPSVFTDDPLRTLRAVRLLAEGVASRVTGATAAALRRCAGDLSTVARERIAAEMNRMVLSRRFAASLDLMQRWGLLAAVAPEALPLIGVSQNNYHHLDCWRHTLLATALSDHTERLLPMLETPDLPPLPCPAGEDLLVLKHAVFAHDFGKPDTRQAGEDGVIHFYGHEKVSAERAACAARRWHFPRRRAERVISLVRHHLRPGSLGPQSSLKACRRLIYAAGGDLNLLLLLTLADSGATRGGDWSARHDDVVASCRRLRQVAAAAGVELQAPRPLLNGRQVMAITGLKAGPELGQVLTALLQLQVEGEVTTAAAAEAAVRKLAGGDAASHEPEEDEAEGRRQD